MSASTPEDLALFRAWADDVLDGPAATRFLEGTTITERWAVAELAKTRVGLTMLALLVEAHRRKVKRMLQ